MVKKRVAEAHTSEGEEAIRRALGELERVSLHHIRSKEAIEKICGEVMALVDGAGQLIRITPERLEQLRNDAKKEGKSRGITAKIQLSEIEVTAQRAKIGNDWNSLKWKSKPPHGWAWREEPTEEGMVEKGNKEIVALVYETIDHPKEHEIFIDREILIHPRGALALIKNMKKRHTALMAWTKKQQKGKRKGAR